MFRSRVAEQRPEGSCGAVSLPSKEIYARLKAEGICVQCGKDPAEGGGRLCSACIEHNREYEKTPKRREAKRKRISRWHLTIYGKFSNNKREAKKRGHSWALNINQAEVFYTRPCHYCGESPNGKLNGIDRQDSSVGYVFENCVPCCPTCNFAKLQMFPDEFIWHCKKVTNFNKKGSSKNDERYTQLTIRE